MGEGGGSREGTEGGLMIKGRKKLNNIIHSKTKLGQGNKSEIDSESKEYRNTTKLKI